MTHFAFRFDILSVFNLFRTCGSLQNQIWPFLKKVCFFNKKEEKNPRHQRLIILKVALNQYGYRKLLLIKNFVHFKLYIVFHKAPFDTHES